MTPKFGISCLIALIGTASFGAVLDDEKFDTGFTTGALHGQNNWFLSWDGPFPTFNEVTIASTPTFSGTKSIQFLSDAMPTGQGMYALTFLPTSVPAGEASVVVASAKLRFSSPVTGGATFGLHMFDPGSRLGGLNIRSSDGSVYTYQDNAFFGAPLAANQWHEIKLVVNAQAQQIETYVNNAKYGSTGTWSGTGISDFDLYGTNGANKGFFDNYLVEKFGFGTLRGTVNLGNYGDPTGVPINITVTPTSGAPQVINTTLDAQSQFTVTTTVRGAATVRIKPSHWLSKTVTGLNISNTGLFNLQTSHLNGDIDGDDEVGSTDFDMVVAQFGDSGPADIDGDGEVGSSDFDIVVSNFGESGS